MTCGTTHYAGCACHEARRDAEVAALRSLLAALRADAPAPIHKMSYSRVIHTTAGDTWQESEDGVHWVDTPRVYLTDSCGALRRVEVK